MRPSVLREKPTHRPQRLWGATFSGFGLENEKRARGGAGKPDAAAVGGSAPEGRTPGGQGGGMSVAPAPRGDQAFEAAARSEDAPNGRGGGRPETVADLRGDQGPEGGKLTSAPG